MGAKVSKPIVTNKTAHNRIGLGEFWVGENGELFPDPAHPEIRQAAAFDNIKHRKITLQAGKATNSATRYSNRRPRV